MASIARDKMQQPMVMTSEGGDMIQIHGDQTPDMFSVEKHGIISDSQVEIDDLSLREDQVRNLTN